MNLRLPAVRQLGVQGQTATLGGRSKPASCGLLPGQRPRFVLLSRIGGIDSLEPRRSEVTAVAMLRRAGSWADAASWMGTGCGVGGVSRPVGRKMSERKADFPLEIWPSFLEPRVNFRVRDHAVSIKDLRVACRKAMTRECNASDPANSTNMWSYEIAFPRHMKISWGFAQMEEWLEGSLASLPRVEQQQRIKGRQVQRLLLQAHIQQRGTGDVGPALQGAPRIVRLSIHPPPHPEYHLWPNPYRPDWL